jgi:hypothetical protein
MQHQASTFDKIAKTASVAAAQSQQAAAATCLLVPCLRQAHTRSVCLRTSALLCCRAAVCDAQGLCTCWSNATATQPPACYSPAHYTCKQGTQLLAEAEAKGQCSILHSNAAGGSFGSTLLRRNAAARRKQPQPQPAADVMPELGTVPNTPQHPAAHTLMATASPCKALRGSHLKSCVTARGMISNLRG